MQSAGLEATSLQIVLVPTSSTDNAPGEEPGRGKSSTKSEPITAATRRPASPGTAPAVQSSLTTDGFLRLDTALRHPMVLGKTHHGHLHKKLCYASFFSVIESSAMVGYVCVFRGESRNKYFGGLGFRGFYIYFGSSLFLCT